jgi:hypothetical protein
MRRFAASLPGSAVGLIGVRSEFDRKTGMPRAAYSNAADNSELSPFLASTGVCIVESIQILYCLERTGLGNPQKVGAARKQLLL